MWCLVVEVREKNIYNVIGVFPLQLPAHCHAVATTAASLPPESSFTDRFNFHRTRQNKIRPPFQDEKRNITSELDDILPRRSSVWTVATKYSSSSANAALAVPVDPASNPPCHPLPSALLFLPLPYRLLRT